MSVVSLLFLFYFSDLFDSWNNDLPHAICKASYLSLEAVLCAWFIISIKNFRLHFPLERLLALFGSASFSIYLWHEQILEFAKVLSISNDLDPEIYPGGLFTVCVVLPIVISISFMSYKFIEEPFFNFRVKYSD